MAKEVAYVADFDSATGMLRALAASLRGEGLPLLGAMHRSKAPLMKDGLPTSRLFGPKIVRTACCRSSDRPQVASSVSSGRP